MPVTEIAPGKFRWGKHGHVYSSRAKAEAQGRAVLATGWREDARKNKAYMHKILKASTRAETRYVQDLRKIFQSVHQGTMLKIKPFLEDLVPEEGLTHRRDASPRDVAQKVRGVTTQVIGALRVHVAQHVGAAFDRMSGEVNDKNKQGMRLLGIYPQSTGQEDILAAARQENINLVERALRDYAEDVRTIFEDEENFGVRVEDLKDKLWDLMKDKSDASESRAQLIARDQTLKLNGALTKDRHQSAGIDSYTWSTSLDERVREEHAALEGQEFDWDDPPEPGHPGEDFQCRCIPVPVFPEEESTPTR
jgi:SPP1 gp7 family putative phage head morphogenesis protein